MIHFSPKEHHISVLSSKQEKPSSCAIKMVVQCTWKSTDGRDISDAVSWASAEESQNNDVEEEVQAENCLLLVAPTESSSEFLAIPACQLLISCHPMQRIQYISVLSDARVMEVYGHHGEYLKTIKNELLEEVEDMAVFKGDVKLNSMLNVCSIKFACLRSKNEMWLYGVKVGIVNAPNQEENGVIPYLEVEKRLSEMGLNLSDKAKAFKELVEAQNPNFSSLNNMDINALINLFKSAVTTSDLSHLQNINDTQNTADSPASNSSTIVGNGDITEINGDLENNEPNNNNNTKSVELSDSTTQTLDPPPPSVEDVIKLHIDQKIEELEKQLAEKIEKSFKEIETKLFCKLDEIESFVKPQGV